MHWGEFALMDYSESVATFRFYFGAITSVSLPSFLSQFGALRSALDNITLGTIVKERWVGDETELNNIPPDDPLAQRELKWLVSLENLSGGNYFYFTIPCPDLSLTEVYNKRQFANPTLPEIMAFMTAVEDIVADPVYGQVDCHITEMQIVGRDV